MTVLGARTIRFRREPHDLCPHENGPGSQSRFPARSVLGVDPDTGEYVTTYWPYRGRSGDSHHDATVTAGVVVYRFAAPLVFANAEAFSKTGEQLLIEAAARNELPKALVIDFEEVFEVDSTGAAAVTTMSDYTRRYDVELHLARVHSTTREMLQIAGVVDDLGGDRIHDSIHGAVAAVNNKPTDATDP